MLLPGPQNAVDAALLRDLSAGKLDALAALYDRLAECLYGLAVRICANEVRAGEIVEHVFTEIWERRERGATINEFVPRLLARCRELALDARGPAYQATRTVTHHDSAPGATGDTQNLLDRLPADARAAIEIAYFEGLPVDAIAARMGATRSQVLEHLRVSLDGLRPTLDRGALPGAGS